MMMHEHDDEGERFRRIAALSNGCAPPSDGCNTYRAAFALLQEFEQDPHTHIHLENNILFPKAVVLEGVARSTDGRRRPIHALFEAQGACGVACGSPPATWPL